MVKKISCRRFFGKKIFLLKEVGIIIFEIQDVDALGRIGKLSVNNKEIITPNLLPVIHPYKNIINPNDLKEFGVNCLFTNAYILYRKLDLREKVIKKGIHKYLNFDGLIATDSGEWFILFNFF